MHTRAIKSTIVRSGRKRSSPTPRFGRNSGGTSRTVLHGSSTPSGTLRQENSNEYAFARQRGVGRPHVLSTARCLDSRRVDCRDGSALLSSLFALPDADGLGVDFGRNLISAASNARAQNARQARPGGHRAGDTGCSRDRHPHRAADEFAWRFRARFDPRRAEQHAGDSSATRKRERVAGGRRTHLHHLVGCARRTCRHSCRAGNRKLASWHKRRWGSSRALAANCCCSWPRSSSPAS